MDCFLILVCNVVNRCDFLLYSTNVIPILSISE